MKVKVKKLNKLAVMPKKAYGSDYCYDVVATSKEYLNQNTIKYGIGLAFEIIKDSEYQDVSIEFRPRSSVFKTGLMLSNSVGTIDFGYRGEVSAVFYHVVRSLKPYEVGDRIGQICISITQPMEFIESCELNDSERGNGGYGSTGVK